jgi:hypothetical protein
VLSENGYFVAVVKLLSESGGFFVVKVHIQNVVTTNDRAQRLIGTR